MSDTVETTLNITVATFTRNSWDRAEQVQSYAFALSDECVACDEILSHSIKHERGTCFVELTFTADADLDTEELGQALAADAQTAVGTGRRP